MDSAGLISKQKQAVLDGSAERAVELAREAVEGGADLMACIDDGYVAGIQEVGRLWEEGEFFLPELVQGADAMKSAMDVLRPALLSRDDGPKTEIKVVIGTVEGDIHDIGKTLVATFLEANGFKVIDLGRDVPVDRFVETVVAEEAQVVGLSALLTTTMPAQARVIELLKERGAKDKTAVLIGGAPVTRSFMEEIGADGFAANAVEAVAKVKELSGMEK